MIRKRNLINKYSLLSLAILAVNHALASNFKVLNPTLHEFSYSTASTQKQQLSLLPALVALRINGVEKSFDSVNSYGDEYVVNLKKLNSLIGLKPKEMPDKWDFETPIGKTSLFKKDAYHAQQEVFLSLEALETLGIRGEYNSSDLALDLYVPWDLDKNNTLQDESGEVNEQQPAYKPSPIGLNELSFHTGYQDAFDYDSGKTANMSLGASGAALGGVWGLRFQGNGFERNNQQLFDDSQLELTNVYWEASSDNVGVRLGVSQSSFEVDPFSQSDFTGASLAYSNSTIARHLENLDSNTYRLLKSSRQDLRHIRGEGPAGGVAELRINGQTIASVRIGLDKHYEFLNLNGNWFGNGTRIAKNRIEIALFNHAYSTNPVSIERVVLGRRSAHVATDELLVESNIGQLGNALKFNNTGSEQLFLNNKPKGLLVSTYAEYGATNELAVRGGFSYIHNANSQTGNSSNIDDNQITGMIGANIGLSTSANLDVSHFESENNTKSELVLNYKKVGFEANYNVDWRTHESTNTVSDSILDSEFDDLENSVLENGNSVVFDQSANQEPIDEPFESALFHSSKKIIQQVLSLHYDVNPYTSISFLGFQDDKSDVPTKRSFSASLQTAPNDDVTAAVYRNRDESYSYRVGWQPKDTHHKFSIDGGFFQDLNYHALSWRRTFYDRHHIGAKVSYGSYKNSRLRDSWYSNAFWGYDFNYNNKFTVGISNQESHFGYFGEWQYFPNSGIRFSAGLKKNYLDGLLLASGQELNSLNSNNIGTSLAYAQLTLDARLLPKQGVILDRYQYHKDGTILVNIETEGNDTSLPDQLNFRLDNIRVLANKVGKGKYVINGIKPGLYDFSMDSKNLPFIFSTADIAVSHIRVSNAAVTPVPIELHKTYGVLGRLQSAGANVPIHVWKLKDKTAKSFETATLEITQNSQAYGYFQLVGLKQGSYLIKAKGFKDKIVSIIDDVVFNIVLEATDK